MKLKMKKSLNEYVEEIEKFASIGLSQSDIATLWGISRRTLARWLKEFPDLKQAWKKGLVKAKKSVLKAMFDAITKRHNATLIIFWLINRHPDEWKDIRNVKIGGENGGTLKVEFIPARNMKGEGEGEGDKS